MKVNVLSVPLCVFGPETETNSQITENRSHRASLFQPTRNNPFQREERVTSVLLHFI